MSAGGFLLEPAERARRRFVRLAAVTAIGRASVRDRSLRLPLLAFAHAGTALFLATVVPMWTLLVGPIVLGVPHVIADVRYLVLERPRGLRDAQILGILVPLAVATALAVAVPSQTVGMLLVPGLLAMAAAIVFASARPIVRVAALAVLAAAAVPLALHAHLTLLVLAHAHNAIAIGLWLVLSRGRARPLLRFAAAAAFLAGGVAIGSGALDAIPLFTGGWTTPVTGFDAESVGETFALPGLGAHRSLMLFAYGQAVHYAVWLRLVPGERSSSEVPVSFRRGVNGLRTALGAPAFAVALVLVMAVPAFGLAVPVETRRIYLDLAGAHAWLELAIAAHLGLAWLSRR